MAEEKDVTKSVAIPAQPDEVDLAFQKFANKCFELGQLNYKAWKQERELDVAQTNLLRDADNLAKDHDTLLAKRNKSKVELPKAPETPNEQK